jgi:hypothetical protein
MNDRCRDVLLVTWNLAQRQHELLSTIVPACHEIAQCFIDDRVPTLEETQSWVKQQQLVNQKLIEVSEAYALARLAVLPFQLDS